VLHDYNVLQDTVDFPSFVPGAHEIRAELSNTSSMFVAIPHAFELDIGTRVRRIKANSCTNRDGFGSQGESTTQAVTIRAGLNFAFQIREQKHLGGEENIIPSYETSFYRLMPHPVIRYQSMLVRKLRDKRYRGQCCQMVRECPPQRRCQSR
jgi:hypothetical protein